jgi:hypothetical protein
MTELDEIQRNAEDRRLDFLLIGGMAVIEHGFARLTIDIKAAKLHRFLDDLKDVLELAKANRLD